MKYIKLFESMTDMEVAKICRKYDIENWSINKDGLVDVDGNVDLSFGSLPRLPLRFGKVTGAFSCSDNRLTTLEGAPQEVGGDFYCSNNKLTTLKGAPKEVGGDFYCFYNNLTTLRGAPTEVGGEFSCFNNNLITLEGAPTEVGGEFSCEYNNLITLEGAPKEVGGDFSCYNNNLTTLEGGPKEVGGKFYCYDNKLITLKGAPEYIGSEVDFLPNEKLPIEFLEFLELNNNRNDLQTYIFKWQKDYAVWRRDGSFNQSNFIQMMEAAQDELENIKLLK